MREIEHAMGLEFRPVGGLMESQTSDKKVIAEVVFVIFREKGGFVQCWSPGQRRYLNKDLILSLFKCFALISIFLSWRNGVFSFKVMK